METVLVGLDPPPTGVEPLRWAADYCRVTGDELVAVVAHHPPPAEPPPAWYEEELAVLRKQSAAALDALAPPVPHRLEVARGEPSTLIAQLAHEEHAAMAVVGAPGSDGFRGLGLGTHHLPVPLVIVPGLGGPLPGGSVAVGLDGSPADAATLERAVRLAEALRGSVWAVVATEPAVTSARDGDVETRARRHVAAIAGRGVDITVRVEDADPVTALTRVADEVDASVVVVGEGGIRHHGGVLVGHVPAELAFTARRPVAVIPQRSIGLARRREPVSDGSTEAEVGALRSAS